MACFQNSVSIRQKNLFGRKFSVVSARHIQSSTRLFRRVRSLSPSSRCVPVLWRGILGFSGCLFSCLDVYKFVIWQINSWVDPIYDLRIVKLKLIMKRGVVLVREYTSVFGTQSDCLIPGNLLLVSWNKAKQRYIRKKSNKLEFPIDLLDFRSSWDHLHLLSLSSFIPLHSYYSRTEKRDNTRNWGSKMVEII